MRSFRIFILLTALAAAVFLPSCYVAFREPFFTDAESRADGRLIGNWIISEGDNVLGNRYAVTRRGPDGLEFRVVYVKGDKEFRLDIPARCYRAGGLDFLCFDDGGTAMDPGGKTGKYLLIFNYTVTDDTLVLRFLDTKLFENLADSGKAAGFRGTGTGRATEKTSLFIVTTPGRSLRRVIDKTGMEKIFFRDRYVFTYRRVR